MQNYAKVTFLSRFGTGHFCLSLHIAMQIGLYHYRQNFCWCKNLSSHQRIVSEDPTIPEERGKNVLNNLTDETDEQKFVMLEYKEH